MSAWLKRFGLHLAAAVGATSIFVAAAAVGATQTRHQTAAVSPGLNQTVGARPRPTLVSRASPSPGSEATPRPDAPVPNEAAGPSSSPRPNQPRRTPTSASAPASGTASNSVAPERSLAGTIVEVLPDGLDVLGVGGREWHVVPVPGALLRLNGKATPLDALQAGDSVVILGQAQARDGPLYRFLAHAITARRK